MNIPSAIEIHNKDSAYNILSALLAGGLIGLLCATIDKGWLPALLMALFAVVGILLMRIGVAKTILVLLLLSVPVYNPNITLAGYNIYAITLLLTIGFLCYLFAIVSAKKSDRKSGYFFILALFVLIGLLSLFRNIQDIRVLDAVRGLLLYMHPFMGFFLALQVFKDPDYDEVKNWLLLFFVGACIGAVISLSQYFTTL